MTAVSIMEPIQSFYCWEHYFLYLQLYLLSLLPFFFKATCSLLISLCFAELNYFRLFINTFLQIFECLSKAFSLNVLPQLSHGYKFSLTILLVTFLVEGGLTGSFFYIYFFTILIFVSQNSLMLGKTGFFWLLEVFEGFFKSYLGAVFFFITGYCGVYRLFLEICCFNGVYSSFFCILVERGALCFIFLKINCRQLILKLIILDKQKISEVQILQYSQLYKQKSLLASQFNLFKFYKTISSKQIEKKNPINS